MQLSQVITLIEQQGFTYRGHFNAQLDECLISSSKRLLPKNWPSDSKVKSIIMVGHIGSTIWFFFAASKEYHDGLANPLDRYSQRVGESVAEALGGIAVMPSDAAFYPFMQWAQRASSVAPSKLQLLMDAEYGLWHAYRYAILLPYAIYPETQHAQDGKAVAATKGSALENKVHSLCENCHTKPCLSACPVNAFTENGFDSLACRQYILEHASSSCAKGYCRARMACPIGTEYRYNQAQAKFHMQSFVNT